MADFSCSRITDDKFLHFAETLIKDIEGAEYYTADIDPNNSTFKGCGGALVGSRWGMTAGRLKDVYGKCFTAAEIKNISFNDALCYYYKAEYKDYGLERIDSKYIINIVADVNIQYGNEKGIVNLKNFLKTLGYYPDIPVFTISKAAHRKLDAETVAIINDLTAKDEPNTVGAFRAFMAKKFPFKVWNPKDGKKSKVNRRYAYELHPQEPKVCNPPKDSDTKPNNMGYVMAYDWANAGGVGGGTVITDNAEFACNKDTVDYNLLAKNLQEIAVKNGSASLYAKSFWQRLKGVTSSSAAVRKDAIIAWLAVVGVGFLAILLFRRLLRPRYPYRTAPMNQF